MTTRSAGLLSGTAGCALLHAQSESMPIIVSNQVSRLRAHAVRETIPLKAVRE